MNSTPICEIDMFLERIIKGKAKNGNPIIEDYNQEDIQNIYEACRGLLTQFTFFKLSFEFLKKNEFTMIYSTFSIQD